MAHTQTAQGVHYPIDSLNIQALLVQDLENRLEIVLVFISRGSVMQWCIPRLSSSSQLESRHCESSALTASVMVMIGVGDDSSISCFIAANWPTRAATISGVNPP